MKIKSYAMELKEWAKSHGYTVDPYKVNTKPPNNEIIEEIKLFHHDLVKLYDDCNGAVVAWGSEEDEIGGILKVPSANELVIMMKDNKRRLLEFDDDFIVNSGFKKNWWEDNLHIFRSLNKFYDEGNGDGIFISSENDKIYLLFHDWMDWICDEPPIIELSNSIETFFNEWSIIQFSNPNDLYWMSAVKEGKFLGFTCDSFMTHK